MVRLVVGLALLVMASAASATWRMAETPHFRIHGTMSEARLREEAAVLEDYHRLLVFLTGRSFAPDAPRLDIYLVDSSDQLRIVRPGKAANVVGFYAPTPGGIVAMAMEPGAEVGLMGGRDILLHEYAHHFMMQAGNAALPAWYVEGFAEYLMTAEFRSDRIDFGGISDARYYSLSTLPWVPLEDILRGRQGVKSESFYAQSWLLTHYLNRVEGMAAKRDAYLRRVTEGADPVEAFRAEVAPDLVAFQRTLRSYLGSRKITFTRMTRKPPAAAEVRVTELPDAADQALLPLLAVQLPQKPEHDARNLARIREAAGRHPDDPWAARALAIAEAAVGDPKVAAARLDALLAASPNDPQLLRWRAELHEADRPGASAADVSAARRLLVRAFKAAPNDWQVLSAYAATFEGRPGPMPEAALDVLGKAHELAPQEKTLAYRTGLAMARAGHHDLARQALAPLVNDPHAGGSMEGERALLAALRQKDQAAVDRAILALDRPAPEAGAAPPP